jgi:UDP-glucose 4-epimerase
VRALVTGGAGFIGSHLVRALVERGDAVTVLDDFSSGVSNRLDDLRSAVEILEGDLRDVSATRRAMAGQEVVFHLGAVPSIARSFRDPARTVSVNVDGTVVVMVEAAAAGIRRVIFAGSSSIYGAAPPFPRREDQTPDPRSPYAASKLAAEHLVHSLGASNGLETAVLRYFNVFGPSQDPSSEYAAAIPRFVVALLRGTAPVVYGDGSATRDFTYVDNVVSANLLAARSDRASGTTFNVGCGGEISVNELLQAIGEELGIDVAAEYAVARPGDVPRTVADISRARDVLGYEVVIPFREGLRRTIASYRALRAPMLGVAR